MNKVHEKMENDIAIFRDTLERYIQPVTYGAIMSGPYTDAVRPLSPVVYDTQHRIKIFISENSRIYFLFQRRLPFSAQEKKLIEDVIVGLRQINGEDRASDSLHVQEVMERVVAFHISRDYSDLVFRLIQMYKEWAEKTGTEALSAHTTGVYFNRQKNTGCNIFTMFDDGLIRSMGSTDKTLLAIDRNGYIQSVENIQPTVAQVKKQQNVLAPVSVADIAMWTDYRNKAVIRLTQRGDILLFRNRKLVFARVFSQWRYFPHGTIMDEIFSEEITQEEKDVRKAVYLTLLDLVFDGKGARIGILDDPERQQKRLERIHSRFRFSPVLQAERNSFLTTILGARKFHEIPRKIRAELCSLDGVLLLGTRGDIFAGKETEKKHEVQNLERDNALLRPSGKKHDLGIRISELGYVEIYKNSDIPLAFA